MNSLIVVVVDIFPEQPSQMVFVQDDDVIEKLSAHASNEPFSGSVLPWASEGRSLGVDPEALDGVSNRGREDREPAKLAKRLRLRRGESLIHKRLAS